MKTQLKRFIRSTPPYRKLRQIRARKELHSWTSGDQKILAFWQQFVRPGDLCFDIGANIGARVKILRALQGRVVAVEPQPECLRILQSAYETDPNVIVVAKALGEGEGTAEMAVSDAWTLSSLSPEWIAAVKHSGRFADYTWDKKIAVPVTTLDRLIQEHGKPAFIKIDVEGYEAPVVRGLSQPVRYLSLEFTPEFLDSTFQCINHLSSLGEIRLNYASETNFLMDEWTTSAKIMETLSALRKNHHVYGNLYVAFADSCSVS
jgi:FkbM family methyltransferase